MVEAFLAVGGRVAILTEKLLYARVGRNTMATGSGKDSHVEWFVVLKFEGADEVFMPVDSREYAEMSVRDVAEALAKPAVAIDFSKVAASFREAPIYPADPLSTTTPS